MNKRHYEHTLPNIRGSLSNTYGRNCLDGEELLDNQDLCLLLKVAPRTLTRYRKKGILPFLMLDGRCYYRATDVHKLIREKTD